MKLCFQAFSLAVLAIQLSDAFKIEMSKDDGPFTVFDSLDVTPTDGSIDDWYGFSDGAKFSANTPQEYEKTNGNWLGIAAVQTDGGTDISLVVIYDKPNDGTGGVATTHFECDGCGALDGAELFPILDDPSEKIKENTDSFQHKWASCCTDGFASKPLAAGSTICLTFSNTEGVDNGVRYHSPIGTLDLFNGVPNGVKICMDLTAPEVLEEIAAQEAAEQAAAEQQAKQAALPQAPPAPPAPEPITCQTKVASADATCQVHWVPSADFVDSPAPGLWFTASPSGPFPLGDSDVTVTAPSSGSTCDAKLTVVDTTTPTLQLQGPGSLFVSWNKPYDEPGWTTSDNCDKDVTVLVGGEVVDSSKIGTYVLTYMAEDDAGNQSPVLTRRVTVRRDCVYGTLNAVTNECDCIGGPWPSAGHGYCHDDSGACTIPRKWNPSLRQFYCGEEPNKPEGCITDVDCNSVDFGAVGGVCVDKDNDEIKECIPKPYCAHGAWNSAAGQCVCMGAPGGNGYCLDANGSCTLARSFDFVAWRYYCPSGRRLRGDA